MTRGFYRFYLYIISSALLIFMVDATSQLLSTLFALTPLRGTYAQPPTQAEIVQALVFAVVAWLISGTLGGLHYWLIRRDMRSDPAAATSGIRSFFLNLIEGVGALYAVSNIGFGVIGTWGYNGGYGLSGNAAFGLTLFVMVGLLELERRRTPLQRGAALVFQRLHFFGVQLILLCFLALAFFFYLQPLVNQLFFTSEACNPYGYCPTYNLMGLGLTVLWFIACWLVYGLVTRADTSRAVRMVMHGASLAFGIGYVLFGVYSALESLLMPLFRLTQGNDLVRYAFITPLLLGLLATAVYHLLLRDVSQRGLLGTLTRRLSAWAIAGLLLAVTFWWGIGYELYNLLQGQAVTDNQAWVNALALLITGVCYIPLDLYLRRRYALNLTGSMGPRRGFVLGLLGASLLTLAIGGAAALYAWGTNLLGSPIGNWLQVAHSGLAAAIVGVVVAGIYLWTARGEQLFTRRVSQPPVPMTPVAPSTPAVSATIEEILDELLAGRINREDAATRIRALNSVTVEAGA